MSAGSKTNPHGYSLNEESLEQFEISDERTRRGCNCIAANGYEPVWKDWDTHLIRTMSTFSIEEINRYSRQLMLEEVGAEGQKKIKQAKFW